MMLATDAVLRARLKTGDAHRWDAKTLRLPCDGTTPMSLLLTDEGWTLRELEAVPGWRELRDRDYDALIAAAREHWTAQWARDDDEARAALAARERKVRTAAWHGCGVDEGLRADVYRAGAADYFGGRAEHAKVREAVQLHPWPDEDATAARYLNLAILGRVGAGKSLLSAMWLHGHIMSGETGRFVRAHDFTRALLGGRASRRREDHERAERVLDDLGNAAFLVLDDLGAEAADREPASLGAVIELLEIRSTAGRPTCFTSNCAPGQLEQLMDFSPRGYSRLFHRALVLELTKEHWPDWRAPPDLSPP